MDKVLNTYNEYTTVLIGDLLVVLHSSCPISAYTGYWEVDPNKVSVKTEVLFSGGIDKYTELAKNGIGGYHTWAMMDAIAKYHEIKNSPQPEKEYKFRVTYNVDVTVLANDDVDAENLAYGSVDHGNLPEPTLHLLSCRLVNK